MQLQQVTLGGAVPVTGGCRSVLMRVVIFNARGVISQRARAVTSCLNFVLAAAALILQRAMVLTFCSPGFWVSWLLLAALGCSWFLALLLSCFRSFYFVVLMWPCRFPHFLHLCSCCSASGGSSLELLRPLASTLCSFSE